jgi:hypothetical protein
MLMLPLTALVFGGMKVSAMVQADPGETSVQSSVATTEGSVDSAEATVSGAFPQLVTFTAFDEDIFAGTLPKAMLVASRHTDGAGMLMSIFAISYAPVWRRSWRVPAVRVG